MMKQEIIMAGFGGQGVMLIGKLLAYAGMKEDKEVTWMPSYGPEMRGGTANSTVVIADKQIASPFSAQPDIVVVMNLPSLEKFEAKVKSGGMLFINGSMVEREIEREDVEGVYLPANEVASELGSKKVANMVMLGAYVSKTEIISLSTLKDSLSAVLPKRRHNLIPINEKALDKGAELVGKIEKI